MEDRDSVISEMDKLTDPPEPKPDPAPEDKPPEEPVADPPAPEPDPPADPDPPEPEPVTDPKAAKAIESIQREEKRSKAAHAARLKELRVAEEDRRQLDQVADLARRRDPVAILEAFGFADDEFELVSKKAYLRSRKGKPADPKAAAGPDRQTHVDVAIEEANRRIAELEHELRSGRQAETLERKINDYVDGVAKAAGDATPLVKSMLTKNPSRARAAIRRTADRLAEETGLIPDHEDVLEALEKDRRSELEDLGVDLSYLNKPKTQPAGEKRTAPRTLGSDLSTPKTPTGTSAKSRTEEVEETRRAMELGQLE